MLFQKFPSLPQIFVLVLIECSFVVVVVLSEDIDYSPSPRGLPLVHIGELDERDETPREWFRVRRQEESPQTSSRISERQIDFGEQQGDDPLTFSSVDYTNYDNSANPGISEFDNVQNEEDNVPSGSIRNRRVSYQPVYRQQGGGSVDSDGRCKCDLEYIMKYRSNPVYYARSGGAFHVKVVHEESGRFSGANSGEAAIPIRDGGSGWPGRYSGSKFANSGGFQQRAQNARPANVEYYVEEVETPPGGRNNMFSRRTGPSDEKSGQGGGYKSGRTIRSKLSLSRKLARVARSVVKGSRWATLTVMSSSESVFGGYPYSRTCRVSDGTSARNSTGVPYIFLTPGILDAINIGSDLEITDASLSISPFDSCESNEDQDEEPWKCSRVILSGIIIPVTASSELDTAADSLTSRHSERHFQVEGYFGKMIIKNVVIQQNPVSGGAQSVLVNDYLN